MPAGCEGRAQLGICENRVRGGVCLSSTLCQSRKHGVREELYLQMRGITKTYPENEVLANDRVDFEVRENEIHAVVGENGAGKTTLMKILYGLEQPDSGDIFFKAQQVRIHSPLDATRLGIGMVHQPVSYTHLRAHET